MANLTGQTLNNRYQVIESLGRGGMAEVYKVWDTQRGTHLAMKVLREDLAEDRVFLRRFQREASNLAKLQHPNIVRFYGLEQEEHIAFILMDFINGITLRRRIFDAKGPLPLKEVMDFIRPICSALHYAHQQGIVHCDLKSANIMLDANGKVYLTDFGIARMSDAATATLVGVGTPAYMAPELVKGMDPSPQTDIYALGVVLYEMLTGGERPFTGDKASITGTTAEKVRWEQLNQTPVSPRTYNPAIPGALENVVLRCLVKESKDRYLDALELRNALQNEIDYFKEIKFSTDNESIQNKSTFTDPQIDNQPIKKDGEELSKPPTFPERELNEKNLFEYYLSVWKKYAVFEGRARRKEYWSFTIINILIGYLLDIIYLNLLYPHISFNAYQISVYIYWIAILIPSYAVGVRRMHDINRSGWWLLAPVLNTIFALQKGTIGENKYGLDPKVNNR